MSEIIIRHSGAGDIERIRQLYAQPSVYANTLQLPFPSPEAWARRFGQLAEGSYSLVACRGEEVLGQLGLTQEQAPRRRHVANIGMGVSSSARRMGVGSLLMSAAIELAEQWLAVRRMELSVYTDNQAAMALYRKFGFAIEGTFAQSAFRDGVYVDVHAMARLAQAAQRG